MEELITIKSEKRLTYIIKKSKFICIAKPMNSFEDFNSFYNDLRIQFKDSSHIPYAYKIEMLEKKFDDGEPLSLASSPIMNIIKKNNLSNIAIFVVRYFGGIKLGAGGLSRAYGTIARDTIKLCEIYKASKFTFCQIISCIECKSKILSFLKNFNIDSIVYDEKINIKVYVSDFQDFIIKMNKIDKTIIVNKIDERWL
jgi:putative IMPACT (imprinted ancient) family translation regulator